MDKRNNSTLLYQKSISEPWIFVRTISCNVRYHLYVCYFNFLTCACVTECYVCACEITKLATSLGIQLRYSLAGLRRRLHYQRRFTHTRARARITYIYIYVYNKWKMQLKRLRCYGTDIKLCLLCLLLCSVV